MSTMIKKTMVLGAVAIALVACGKKEDGAAAASGASTTTVTGAPGKSIGACNKVSNVGKCSEYDMSKDTLGLNKGGCEATDGKWETAACPTEKSFANCAMSDSKIIYYAGTTPADSVLTMDEEFAKLDCEMMSGKLTITGSSKPKEEAAKPTTAGKPAAKPAPKKK